MTGAAQKGKKFPVEILTAAEIDSLLRTCSKRAPTGVRNQALIALLYRSGLRVAEALALLPHHLDAEAGTINVHDGKGGVQRLVSMDSTAFAMVNRWLERRKAEGICSRAPVFCTLAGKALDASYVRVALKRLGRKAGIEKRVHPHGLRHTMAAELAREGVAMNVIQQQLGHANLAITSVYLNHIAPEQLIETMVSREWSPSAGS